MMSILPPSRVHSEVFASSQYGGAPAISKKHYYRNHFAIPSFVIQIIGLACLWTLWYYLRFTTVFPYRLRVFNCRDKDLFNPNLRPEDFNIYVSDDLLYILAFCLPPLVILIGEIAFWLFSSQPRKAIIASTKFCKVHLFTRRMFRFLAVFMFGALITQIFVDTIKLMTGFHRPYFLSLCNVSFPNCTSPLEYSPSPSPYLACNNRNADELRYASLSFPSLHAAFSSFSAIFTSCYLYYMINLRAVILLRPILIFGFLALTLIDSFSRIDGYKNHLRDVIIGWLIGFFIAIFMCRCVMCFQEVYHVAAEKAGGIISAAEAAEEKISPFFSWFKLPRIQAPSVKEEYVVYEEDIPHPTQSLPSQSTARQHRGNQNRAYEVTTTTESLHRTIVPPNQ